jgi:histone H3/H4
MAVTRWSAEAMAELRSLEQAVPRTLQGQLRAKAMEIAGTAGRTQVERLDVCQALGTIYGQDVGDEDEETGLES